MEALGTMPTGERIPQGTRSPSHRWEVRAFGWDGVGLELMGGLMRREARREADRLIARPDVARVEVTWE
jgi:hypothetical protein